MTICERRKGAVAMPLLDHFHPPLAPRRLFSALGEPVLAPYDEGR